MTDRPGVSVVIASNSTPEGIAEAIAGFAAQTYENLEIVVVIDRTTTDPERDEFRGRFPGVLFEFLDYAQGIPAALNAGIAISTGEIIARSDDDDPSAPTRIEKQVALLMGDKLDFAWSQAYGRQDGSGDLWLIDCPRDDAAIKAALLGQRNILVHSTLLGWKASFGAVGNYNPVFKRAQDYELYLRAIRAHMKFGAVQEPLVTRLYSDTSITVKHRKNQIMFSFAAHVLHAAHTGDVGHLVRKTAYYSLLLLIPNGLRQMRRHFYSLSKKGA